nr:acyltransferase [uncultured Acetatifactor sp.]
MEKKQKDVSKSRMANLELLRCIAMMMVVALHYLGKGELLGDLTESSMGGPGIAGWVIESFCIVAVNLYMLISGYFLTQSSFKISRLLGLWLQVWIYSAGIGIFAALTGILPAGEADTHYFLSILFPISMDHYWFLTVYLFLYAALPVIGMGVRKMTKGQMQAALGTLLFLFCLLKSVLPFRLETDGQGYDFIWYLCVFLTAAYIRRFGIPFLEKKSRSVCLYAAGCLGILTELFVLRQVYLRTGSLGLILKIPTEYNHIFPFLASVGLFCLFLQLKVSGRTARAAVRIGPYTLGVYLLHENMGIRYAWQSWLGADRISSAVSLAGYTVFAVATVFAFGILLDAFREFLTGAVLKGIGRTAPGRVMSSQISRLDRRFL